MELGWDLNGYGMELGWDLKGTVLELEWNIESVNCRLQVCSFTPINPHSNLMLEINPHKSSFDMP